MKKFLVIIAFTYPHLQFFAQQNTSTPEELNRMTFCIGIGYSQLLSTPNDYFLTTDPAHTLQVQALNRSNIVISSVISFKVGKLATQRQQGPSGTIKSRLVSLQKTEYVKESDKASWKAYPATDDIKTKKDGENAVLTNKKPTFWESIAVNIGINLADVKSDNVAFNKSIDGGIGVGYFASENLQLSIFLDKIRYRQLRDHIVENYLNKSIPNGNDFYNALDQNNNDLFYSKYFTGWSVKVIFSMGNKK